MHKEPLPTSDSSNFNFTSFTTSAQKETVSKMLRKRTTMLMSKIKEVIFEITDIASLSKSDRKSSARKTRDETKSNKTDEKIKMRKSERLDSGFEITSSVSMCGYNLCGNIFLFGFEMFPFQVLQNRGIERSKFSVT